MRTAQARKFASHAAKPAKSVEKELRRFGLKRTLMKKNIFIDLYYRYIQTI
jgi:hypothetical protein